MNKEKITSLLGYNKLFHRKSYLWFCYQTFVCKGLLVCEGLADSHKLF